MKDKFRECISDVQRKNFIYELGCGKIKTPFHHYPKFFFGDILYVRNVILYGKLHPSSIILKVTDERNNPTLHIKPVFTNQDIPQNVEYDQKKPFENNLIKDGDNYILDEECEKIKILCYKYVLGDENSPDKLIGPHKSFWSHRPDSVYFRGTEIHLIDYTDYYKSPEEKNVPDDHWAKKFIPEGRF
jgi:hypothetical protein